MSHLRHWDKSSWKVTMVEDVVRRLGVRFKAFGDITFSPSSEALIPSHRVLLNGKLIPDYDWPSTGLMPGDRMVLRRRH